jgi:hypothetical protein
MKKAPPGTLFSRWGLEVWLDVPRVDAQHPILSKYTRARLRDRLAHALDVAARSQGPDGSWHIGWNYELLPSRAPEGWSYPDLPSNRVTMTGHIAEWLLYLDEPFNVSPTVLIAAANNLRRALYEATTDLKEQQFCPYSHAACVLRQVGYVLEEEAPRTHPATDR